METDEVNLNNEEHVNYTGATSITPSNGDEANNGGEEVLDPVNSERRYWREPETGIIREVWRPGDGDGNYADDFYDRPGEPAPIERRWRLYQLSSGPVVHRKNEPPRNVILDDLAAYEVMQAGMPKAHVCRSWSHDFGGPAKIRMRRLHRGRPAIRDPNAEGNDRFHLTYTGARKTKYWLSGERGYVPVRYHALALAETSGADSAASAATGGEDSVPVKKQHNQYTAKHLLVRNGAPSSSLTRGKYRARLNTFLRRSSTPPSALDPVRLFGGARGRRNVPASSTTGMGNDHGLNDAGFGSAVRQSEEESMWVDQDDEEEQAVEGEDDEDEQLQDAVTDANDKTYLANEPTGSFRGSKRAVSPTFATAAPRRKAPKQMNFIERMAAQMDEEQPSAAAATPHAQEPEADFAESRSTVTGPRAEIERLRKALEAAEGQIEGLKGV